MLRRLLLAACAALPILVATAAPASANRTQLSVFQDDRLLLSSGAATRDATLDQMSSLGADVVHVVVVWRRIAPGAASKHRPANFDGADPAAYKPASWAALDGVVRGAAARGMRVLLSPSGPIPNWASMCAGGTKVRRTCKPNPTHFKRFVQALGTRYSGSYDGLPRVDLWSIWNEPNQGPWLSPQYGKVGGRVIPVAAGLYRNLVRGAASGLKATGHGSDQILFGETAPIGRGSGGNARTPATAPGTFLKGVLCLDRTALGCNAPFPRLPVTGVSHHPYSRGGSQPPTSKGNSSEITVASRSRLTAIVDAAARKGRLKRNLPVWYTEFGFQTNPPDTIFGVSPLQQATYINQADWIGFNDKRVRSVAQYELNDERNVAAFQTGLRYFNGRVKPSLAAYRLPIWVTKASGGQVRVWGQVRPAGTGASVEIQSGSGNSFTTVSTATTQNAEGYFVVTLPSGGKSKWRLRWAPAGRAAVVSRVASVARR